jgi:hypothetical protein
MINNPRHLRLARKRLLKAQRTLSRTSKVSLARVMGPPVCQGLGTTCSAHWG